MLEDDEDHCGECGAEWEKCPCDHGEDPEPRHDHFWNGGRCSVCGIPAPSSEDQTHG